MRAPAAISIVTTVLVALTTGGCQGKKAEERPQKTGLAAQFDDTTKDIEVMRAATAAANTVARNAADCDVVKASIEDARAKLAEAQKKVQTPTGRASLEVLRRDIDRIADACP